MNGDDLKTTIDDEVRKHAKLRGMARLVVLALVVVALLALATVRLSKGDRMPPPPDSPQMVTVRPTSK